MSRTRRRIPYWVLFFGVRKPIPRNAFLHGFDKLSRFVTDDKKLVWWAYKRRRVLKLRQNDLKDFRSQLDEQE